MKQEGILIAFEGIDGAGKTTQANLLRDALTAVGETVILTKEPTNGKWGSLLRESATSGRLPPEEELKAFEEDRKEHLSTLIEPSLAAGNVVILDRYFYSTVAYQGHRRGSPHDIDARMCSFSRIPDITLLLDADPAVCLTRITKRDERPNLFERVDELEGVRSIFNELPAGHQEIVALDASMSIDALHAQIIEVLLEGAFKKKRCAKKYGCDEPMNCGFRISETCRWALLRADLSDHLAPPRKRALGA